VKASFTAANMVRRLLAAERSGWVVVRRDVLWPVAVVAVAVADGADAARVD